MTENTAPTTWPHTKALGAYVTGRTFHPEPCTSFRILFAQKLTERAAAAVAEILLMSKQADTPRSASQRENAIIRLGNIFRTLASSPSTLRTNDETRLRPYRHKQGAMFTLGDDFFTQVLPGISSQLECLRWEDYQLVRGLRLTLQKSPDTAKSAGHLVRRVIDTARRKNPDILVSQMDTFFPHYSEPDAERVLDLMKFLSALEDEILAHIEINPLYPYVPWSHSKDTKRIPDSEIGQLVAGLRESGFEIMDDFGHGEGPEKNRPMLRNDNVVGIGLMANEAVYVSERTDEMTRQIVEIGLGPKFVDVCQKCFLDPRMARIMKPREGNEGNNGMDAIFDEIALCEVTPEIDAHPLFVYKSGKHGARRANVFAKKRVLDARNYPSYEKLRALVPAKWDAARFINTGAEGDAIDFGVAYHGPNGRIYVITANDTHRTVLDIAKALGNPLFLQTMSAFQQNSIEMFGKFMRAMASIPPKK